MKKLILIIFSIFIISGCTNNKVSANIPLSTKDGGIHELGYEELKQKLDSKDNFVLYIGRPDCGDCAEFAPILEEYLGKNKGMSVYYLNIKTFRDNSRKENASKEEKDFYENMRTELDFNWTPTLHHINEGKTLDTYTYLDEAYYEIEPSSKEATNKKQEFVDNFYKWMEDQFK